MLGLHWLRRCAAFRRAPRTASLAFARSTLIYLLFITLIPFSTMLVGRYDEFAPASWVYAANMIGALAGIAASRLARGNAGQYGVRPGKTAWVLFLLIASALLSVAISLASTGHADARIPAECRATDASRSGFATAVVNGATGGQRRDRRRLSATAL